MPKRPATPAEKELKCKLQRIDKAVAEPSGILAPPVMAMFRAMAPHAITDPKAERHPFQNEVVCWIGDALQSIEQKLESQVEAAARLVDEASDALAAARRRQMLAAPALYEPEEEVEEDEEVKAERRAAERDVQAKQAKLRAAGAHLEKESKRLHGFREGGQADFDRLSGRLLQLPTASQGRAGGGALTDDFTWIRRENTESRRRQRRGVAALTQRAVNCSGYNIGSDLEVMLTRVKEMEAGTRIVSPAAVWPLSAQLSRCSTTSSAGTTELKVIRDTVLEVATGLAIAGRRVAVVSAASAYHAGGGFSTGGRHALEEAICVQTTLYNSLQASMHDAATWQPAVAKPATRPNGSPWEMHIPEDGVILSPMVEVFRGGSAQGYPFLRKLRMLEAIVSVAMPNCNARVSDAPVDAPACNEAYRELLTQKWRATLAAVACFTEADCLIIPDAGCGVFQNPPEDVGSTLGHLLGTEFPGAFKQVVLAFPGGKASEEFAQATREAFAAAVAEAT